MAILDYLASGLAWSILGFILGFATGILFMLWRRNTR